MFAVPPQGTLHRAIVASACRDCEFVVFFECDPAHRFQHLQSLICLAWNTVPEDLDIYNIITEAELVQRWSLGGPRTGDLRLFEAGFGTDGIHYADPSRTVWFVSPCTATRLAAAQLLLPQPLAAEELAA